jgi:hypothetical protein
MRIANLQRYFAPGSPACVCVFAVLLAAALPLSAQRSGAQLRAPLHVPGADGAEATLAHVAPAAPFRLAGLADLAFAAAFPADGWGTARLRLSNAGIAEYYGGPWGLNWVQYGTAAHRATGHPSQRLFQGSLALVSPRSEYLKAQERLRGRGIESLDHVAGGGWNSVWNLNHFAMWPPERWLPADGQLGLVHAGARSTEGGGCTDQQAGLVPAGLPLLAVGHCPATWGAEGFAGAARAIRPDAWLRHFQDAGPHDFTWDWWRVPPEHRSPEWIGDAHSYGAIVDWGLERRARFGRVLPGGAGDPGEEGWPMGITVAFDAFSFDSPLVPNTAFWQALVINESERVWGIGLDYDSLYLGMMHGLVMYGNGGAEYYRPDIGGMIATGSNMNGPNCNGARVPTGVPGCPTGPTLTGDVQGGFAILVLNSPLGDLRNKLFSRPASPYYAPGHSRAGDTITFNIGRMCGFGVACWNSTWARSARSGYGYVSGSVPDLLDGRTQAAFDGLGFSAWFTTFRNHDYPVRTPRWNQWVVPGWDWNRDGVPDTISVPTCLGPEFGGPATGYPCSELFSDTLPGRLLNNRNNMGGFIGFGPFPLKAGDTTRFTLALVSEATAPLLLEAVQATLAYYETGYARALPPPPPRIDSVTTVAGDRGGARRAEVRLHLDAAPARAPDPYLLFMAEHLARGPLAEDNPWLPDSLRGVAARNVAAFHLFKTCDGGRTFTAAADCAPAPRPAEAGGGWRPYASFAADALPPVFVDTAVTPGLSYGYVVVAESRGWSADVVGRDALTGAPDARRLELARPLTTPLPAAFRPSLEPAPGVDPRHAALVYVPASGIAAAPADAAQIRVVPNPYVLHAAYEDGLAERRLLFTGLPPTGTIEIFSVAGRFIQRIRYDESRLAGNGDLFWDLRTFEDRPVTSGLYLFVVRGRLADGRQVARTGKFVVIAR